LDEEREDDFEDVKSKKSMGYPDSMMGGQDDYRRQNMNRGIHGGIGNN
jgi:hypothetical protein